MSFFSKDTLKAVEKMDSHTQEIEFISTGLYQVDKAVGGGFPRQRITEVSGNAGSAKTTLFLLAAAKQIANDKYVALLETERALDYKWMESLGIPLSEILVDSTDDNDLHSHHLHIWHPQFLEEAFNLTIKLYKENIYELIGLDSFGGTPVRAAAEAEDVGDAIMMKSAKIAAAFGRLFFSNTHNGNAAVVITNHVYTNHTQPYFDQLKPEGGFVKSPGGYAFEFYPALRIYMKAPLKIATEKDETLTTGEKLKKGFILGKEHGGMIFKNKTGAKVPQSFKFRLMTYPENYINVPWDIVETCSELNILQQRGRFWFYKDENIAGSRPEMEALLVTNPELSIKIEQDLVDAIMKKDKPDGGETIEAETTPAPAFPGSSADQEFQTESS